MLRTVRVVEIDWSDGQHRQSVTQGSGRAAMVLRALGIKELDPGPGRQNRVA